jgi:hypothetical protein
MLVAFQTALADMTASPELTRQVRREPETLRARYDLTDREWRRLVGVARSKGMQANCMLYRANRLIPAVLNMPDLCQALGDDLAGLLSEYWESEPVTDVHFIVEADRFCRFLQARDGLADEVRAILAREHAVVAAKLAASRLMARPPLARTN